MICEDSNGGDVGKRGGPPGRTPSRSGPDWRLLAIVLVALVLRLSVNAAFQGIAAPPNPAFPDSLVYSEAAASIASGHYQLGGRDSVHAPPGIPFLLAAAKAVALGSWAGPRVLYSLMGALTCLFAYGIACVIGGRRAGLLAAGLLAIYPEHFYWTMHFTPETPGGLFLVAALWLSVLLDRRPSVIGELALGVLVGLAALITPRMLVIAPSLIAMRLAVCYRGRLLLGLRNAALAGLAVALTLSPWTIRNFLVSGQFVLVSSHGGSTFLAGNNVLVESDPAVRGGWYQGPMADIPGWREIRDLRDADRSAAERHLAVDFLRGLSPWRLARLEVMKVYRFVTPILESPNKAYRVLVGGGWAVLAPLLLVGIWRFGGTRTAYGLNAVLLGMLAIALLFFGEARYRAAIAPVLAVYGALGAAYLLRWHPGNDGTYGGCLDSPVQRKSPLP